MEILLESFLAFFSCIGIWTVVQLFFGWLFDGIPNDDQNHSSKDESNIWTKPRNTTK